MNTIQPSSSALIHTSPAPSVSLRSISLTNRTGRPKGSLRGALVSSIGEPRIIYYESGLEKKALLCLLARPDIREVREQQPRVAYVDAQGTLRHHTFDFEVHTSNGEVIAVAVRPFERAKKKFFFDELAWIAAQLSTDVADRIVLITERELPRDLIHNAELIHAARLDPDQSSDFAAWEALTTMDGPIRIGDLVKRAGNHGRSFRAIVRLIAAGALVVKQVGRINHTTFVESAVALRSIA